ncbi:MAG TPA: hypothetical protein VGK40_01330 [Verrucomicrobiae bacterium]|jgi:hypothetical protein
MKKLFLCSMLAAFAVAAQADDAKRTDKTSDAKAGCCADKTACCAKTVKKADSTAKGAMFLVQK